MIPGMKSGLKASAISAKRAIELLGGPVSAARCLNVDRYQTVQSWTANGVPIVYCLAVEEAVGGAVTRRDLRPADWHRIWPELAQAKEVAGV